MIITISVSMHYLAIVTNCYIKMQRGCDYINARLVARHYILSDLSQAKKVGFVLQKLVIHKDVIITYDLRDSVIPKHSHMHSYSLYRTFDTQRAEAIAEGISDWRTINTHTLCISFKDGKSLEIKI